MSASPAGERPPGVVQRRLLRPMKSLLAQGLTPEGLALSLAVGAALGLFPIVGATTLLCLVTGFAFRLNHVALQLANHLVYPLQLPLILAFVRLGERLLGATPVPLDPRTLVARFERDPPGFLREFGLTGLHGTLGWSVVAPVIVVGAFFALRPLTRRLDAARRPAGLPA